MIENITNGWNQDSLFYSGGKLFGNQLFIHPCFNLACIHHSSPLKRKILSTFEPFFVFLVGGKFVGTQLFIHPCFSPLFNLVYTYIHHSSLPWRGKSCSRLKLSKVRVAILHERCLFMFREKKKECKCKADTQMCKKVKKKSKKLNKIKRKVFVYVPGKEEGVQMQSICKLADTQKCCTFCLTFYSVCYSSFYSIFSHTSEKSVMWRNLSTWQIVIWGNSSHVENNSPQEKCEENR